MDKHWLLRMLRVAETGAKFGLCSQVRTNEERSRWEAGQVAAAGLHAVCEQVPRIGAAGVAYPRQKLSNLGEAVSRDLSTEKSHDHLPN